MKMTVRHSCFAVIALSTSLAACQGDEQVEVNPLDAQLAVETLSEAALPLTELEKTWIDDEVYLADLKEIQARGTAPGVQRVKLNLRDALDYRFVVARLQRQGLSVEGQPVLFQKLRAMHVGVIPPNRHPEQVQTTTSATTGSTSTTYAFDCNAMVFSTQTPVQDQYGNTVSSTFSISSTGGCDGGMTYAYLDNGVYRYPAGNSGELTMVGFSYQEIYGWLSETIPTTLDTAPNALSLNGQYGGMGDSLGLFERAADGTFEGYYLYTAYYSPACRVSLLSPNDSNGDGKTVVCLNRSSADCDVKYAYSTGSTLALPTQARLTYSVPANPNAVLNTVNSVRADVFLGSSGTPCQTLVQTPVIKKLSNTTYDLYLNGTNGSQPLAFNTSCAKESNTVKFNLLVTAQGTAGTCQADGPSDNTVGKAVQFVYSCLKPSTLITLADGTERTVESVASAVDRGEQVEITGKDGRPMRVTASVVGPSETLIRLVDETGHALETSDNHPIVTPLGVVKASSLRVGDVVETDDGPRSLTVVEEVNYHGLTYNLSLRPLSGLPAVEDNRMYANHFAVGDFQLQLAQKDEPLTWGKRSQRSE